MQVYANKKPAVSAVTYWTQIFDQGNTRVYEAGNFYDYYKVDTVGERPKYFFGESAWMNCQRFVVDKVGMVGYNLFS